MSLKVRIYILGFYDLLLSIGAVYMGREMINSNRGIFLSYPKEWLSKLPFNNWFIPGILVIAVFGLGNLVASILCFIKNNHFSWCISAFMGGILYSAIVLQAIITGEWYLATVELFVISLLQLFLSSFVYTGYKKKMLNSRVYKNNISDD